MLIIVSKPHKGITLPPPTSGPQAPSWWKASPGMPWEGCTSKPRKGQGVTVQMLHHYLLCLPPTTNLLLCFFSSLHTIIIIIWSMSDVKNGEGYSLYSKSS